MPGYDELLERIYPEGQPPMLDMRELPEASPNRRVSKAWKNWNGKNDRQTFAKIMWYIVDSHDRYASREQANANYKTYLDGFENMDPREFNEPAVDDVLESQRYGN